VTRLRRRRYTPSIYCSVNRFATGHGFPDDLPQGLAPPTRQSLDHRVECNCDGMNDTVQLTQVTPRGSSRLPRGAPG
jgi:hypothetical protein